MLKQVISVGALFIASIASAEVAVIVHPSNDSSIDKTNIERIYTGKEKSFSNGKKALPISQSAGTVLDEFNQKALNKSSGQLKAYWSKLVFTGKGTPPKAVANDAEVLASVAANPDTIGFIDASKVNDSVKVVAKY